MSAANKIFAINLTLRFFNDVNCIPDVILSLTNNFSGIRESYSLFTDKTTIKKKEIDSDDFKVSNIKLENITYKCKNKIILKNFFYEFKTGLYVLYGDTGVGKSTFLQILMGFREVESGNIIYNDFYNLEQYTIGNHVSYMTQNNGIYNRTVYENIFLSDNNKKKNMNNHQVNDENNNYNNEDIYMKQFIEDMKIISLMNNKAGLQGANLSGGQIRKITFLRMLNKYKAGNLILFDEPFLSLDRNLVEKLKEFILNKSKSHIIVVVDSNNIFKEKESTSIILKEKTN